jgi:NitT/TauT family transport system substrate-binding protein
MRLRMLLNTGFSGPQVWLLLAVRRGLVASGGIQLALTPGTGAYNAAGGMIEGGFDLAHGDINAAVERAARGLEAPIGIFASHNAAPSCIAVRADSGIVRPADLAGARLIGHGSDVALRTFGAFCAATGLDPASVAVEPAEGSMASLAARVEANEADGLFCYVSTLSAAVGPGLSGFRCFRYAELVPDLYGSAVMAAPALLAAEPDALRRLLAALNRGMAEAFADPAAAMEAVRGFAPQADAAAELRRWEATLAIEMGHAEGRSGFGAVEPSRFARGVALHAAALGLGVPDPGLLFTDALLPRPGDRARRP